MSADLAYVEEPAPAARPPRPNRWRWVVGLVAATAAFAGVVVAVADGDGDGGSPERALARVRDFVETHPSARVEGTTRETFGDETLHGVVTGSFAVPAGSDVVEHTDDVVFDDYFERLVAAGHPYFRLAASRQALAHATWTDGLDREGGAPGTTSPFALGWDVLTELGVRHGLSRLLDDMNGVERIEDGRLHASFRIRDVLTTAERDDLMDYAEDPDGSTLEGRVNLTLTAADDGRLDELDLDVDTPGAGSSRVVLAFRDWGADITITMPKADEIRGERSSSFGAEGFEPGALGASRLPSGWTETGSYNYAPGEESCAQAEVAYGRDGDEEPLGQVVTRVRPCHYDGREPPAVELRSEHWGSYDVTVVDDPGAFYGYLTDVDEGIAARIVLPDRTILVVSAAGEDVLRQLVESLGPYGP